MEPNSNELIVSVYHWQTLITGLLAAIAAIATIARIGDQIDEDKRKTAHERERKAMSHRALLPLVLADICDFVETDNAKLKAALKTSTRPARLVWPESITNQLETIRIIIEYDDTNSVESNRLRILLTQLQIYRSRRRPSAIGLVSAYDTINRIKDAAEIYVAASELFEYGRGDNFRRHSARDEILRTLRLLGYYEEIDEDVYSHFEKIYPE
jgi:hypothetical protein